MSRKILSILVSIALLFTLVTPTIANDAVIDADILESGFDEAPAAPEEGGDDSSAATEPEGCGDCGECDECLAAIPNEEEENDLNGGDENFTVSIPDLNVPLAPPAGVQSMAPAIQTLAAPALAMLGVDVEEYQDDNIYVGFTAADAPITGTTPGVPKNIVRYENKNRPNWLQANAKAITMKPEGNADVLQYIFVFHVFDIETGLIRTTTLHGKDDKSGNNLERTFATFDDGLTGWWTIGDRVISVDIYDLQENYIQTVLPESFDHRSNNSGTGVILEDGTTDANGVVQSNGGTANFWYKGPGATGTEIKIEKIWLNEAGDEIVAARNSNARITVEKPTGDSVTFQAGNLPGRLAVPTSAHPAVGHANHTFREVAPLLIADGYDYEYVRVEVNGADQEMSDGVLVIDTSKLTPGQQITVTYYNKLIPPAAPKGSVSFTKIKLVNGQEVIAAPADGFWFDLYAYDKASESKIGAPMPGSPFGIDNLNGTIEVNDLEAGWYVFVEQDPPLGWQKANDIVFEMKTNANNKECYAEWPDGSTGDGYEVVNVPSLGSLPISVDIKQQNYLQDWRNWSVQDWRNYYEQDWRNWSVQDWRNWTEQDWRNYSEQDWRNYSEQDWRNYSEQDWRNYSEQDWRNWTEQDWRDYTEQDWRNYNEQDWRNWTEQDWRNYTEQDWRDWTEQDWRDWTEQDWRNWTEQDWRDWTEQDWRNYSEQDWRNVYAQDWRNIIIPVFEKNITSVGGTLVTWRDNKKVPGGTFGNGMTWLTVNVAEASKPQGITYRIADSSPSNKPIDYYYNVRIVGDELIFKPVDGRFISAAVTVKLYSSEPTKHDPSGHSNLTSGKNELKVKLPAAGKTSNSAPAVASVMNSGIVTLSVGGNVLGSIKYEKNGKATLEKDGYTINVEFNGSGVKNATAVRWPAPASSGAADVVYMFVHFDGVKWFTTGEYDFVKWQVSGTEKVNPIYWVRKENVGAPRTGKENVGPRRSGTEDVGALRSGTEDMDFRSGVENVGELRSGTEDVDFRSGVENVGELRSGVENVGAARTGAEDVGAPRIGTEDIGDPRIGTENVGDPRTGAENVGAPRTGVENVGDPRTGTENVGAARTGTENVGAPRTGTENVGVPYKSAIVAYTGELTLTITGPNGYNKEINITNGQYNDTLNDLEAGSYTVALTGYTPVTRTVPAGGTAAAATFNVTKEGVTNQNQLDDRTEMFQLADRNETFKLADRTEMFQLADRDDRIQLADRNETFKLADRNDRIQLADRNDRFQLADRNETFKLADRDDRFQLPDRNDRYQLADRNETFKVADRNDSIQLPDRNDRFQLADRNETFKLAGRDDRIQLTDRNDRIKVADRNDKIELAPRNETFEVGSITITGKQLADMKACDKCNNYDPYCCEHAIRRN